MSTSGYSHPNTYEFIVGFDSYTTHYEDSLPPPNGEWFHEAKYRPNNDDICAQMKVDEELIWRNLNAGRHVIVSGQAGAGKSHLLQRFMDSCEYSNLNVALTAPTGIAAFNVGGETIHARLGLGLAKEDPVTLFNTIKKSQRYHAKTWKFLLETDILVIDEVSMVDPDLFLKLEYLFRKARAKEKEDKKNKKRKRNDPRPQPLNLDPESTFGGIRLVMVGDFTQLGPVLDRNSGIKGGAKLIIDTDTWKLLPLARIFLKRSYRQKDNESFLQLLNEVRMGQLSDYSKMLLRNRVGADVSIHDPKHSLRINGEDVVLKPMDVFPYRSMVDKCNRQGLENLQKKGVKLETFYPRFRIETRGGRKQPDPEEYAQAQETISPLKQESLANKFPLFQVDVAIGAQVMMRCNRYIDAGIFNGSMGIVTAMSSDYIHVAFLNPNRKSFAAPIGIERIDFTCRVGRTVEIVMTQFPLSLAYSITIHRTQSLTLDSVRVDARKCFEPGQFYVILSRVRELQHFSLIDFDERSIMADPRAVAFESMIDLESKEPDSTLSSMDKAGDEDEDDDATLSTPPAKRQRVDTEEEAAELDWERATDLAST